MTAEQKERYDNITAVQASIGFLGSIGGVVYAKKTGGGFWRYLGYWIAGGVAASVVSGLALTPFKNKILKEAQTNQNK